MVAITKGLVCDDNFFKKPFRIIVAGGSGCGKSTFVEKMVSESLSGIDNLAYIYPDYLDSPPMKFSTSSPVENIRGLPSCKTLSNFEPKTLIILDDVMYDVNETIAKLFTVIARKNQLSVILIVQNLYLPGKHFRSIRLNSTGIVLFKFHASVDSNMRVLRDFGLSSLLPRAALERHYSEKFSYIYIDIHPHRHNDFVATTSDIFSKNFKVFYKMEYVAIPKEDFVKYFKIIEAKKGKVKDIKNEIEIKKNKRKRKKRRVETSESETQTETPTDSE